MTVASCNRHRPVSSGDGRLSYISYPDREQSKFMKFEGYIKLPQSSLTLNNEPDDSLVTNNVLLSIVT